VNLLLPERLDALARDYALGTMHGGARRRFERLLREAPQAEQAVATWSGRLAHLAGPVRPMAPRPQVWAGLEQRLFAPAVPRQAAARVQTPAQTADPADPAAAGETRVPPRRAPQPQAQPRRPEPGAGLRAEAPSAGFGGWLAGLAGAVFGGRVWAGALAGALLCVVVLRQQPQWAGLETHHEALPASYVGLLLDAGGKPAVLASSRRHGQRIDVKLLQPLAVPEGRVAQLWGLPKDGGAPFPIGVVPPSPKAPVTTPLPLPESAEKLFFNTTRLAVSFEPAPASAGARPSGEFVLSGHCVKLW